MKWPEIEIKAVSDGLLIKAADEKQLSVFLIACYERLAAIWWNVSNQKQIESKDIILFDKDKDEFICLPKRQPTPVAALSVAGGSSWRAEADEFASLSEEMKKRAEAFCKESGKKLWGAKNKLVYTQPVCHSQINLFPKKGKKQVCSVCGREMVCEGVNQTAFPLFASESASFTFNSELGNADKICWECALLGKFAVHAVHYKAESESLLLMQLTSGNLLSLIRAHKDIGTSSAIRNFDPETLYFRNFGSKKSIIEWAKLPYEILWGFYVASYETVLKNLVERKNAAQNTSDDEFEQALIEEAASIGTVMMSASSKGNTFITQDLINFNDSAYIFRLIRHLKDAVSRTEPFAKEPHKFLNGLFMDLNLVQNQQKQFDPINGIYRNRILQKIFNKASILQEAEQFVYKKSLAEDCPYIGRILFFTILYENVINKRDAEGEGGTGMTRDQVDIAAKLGSQIVLAAKETLAGDTHDRERLKPLKGDLFALRKARTVADFLGQINRLQFRYGIVVNSELAKGILEEPSVRFEDFKSYCMISALNSYNAAARKPHTDNA